MLLRGNAALPDFDFPSRAKLLAEFCCGQPDARSEKHGGFVSGPDQRFSGRISGQGIWSRFDVTHSRSQNTAKERLSAMSQVERQGSRSIWE